MELGGVEEDEEVVRSRDFFFFVIMWSLFRVDVAAIGGFWRLKFFFFLCGGCFLWLWLLLVVDLVI